MTYIDSYFEAFINLTKVVDNSVFIFYNDHGVPGINKADLELILKRPLSNADYRRAIKKGIAFIYAPGDTYNDDGLKIGLLKGEQHLVRGQVDLYPTILDLFNLSSDYMFFGTHALSDEASYSVDPKSFNIFTDDETILGPKFHHHKNTKKHKNEPELEQFYNRIYTFKSLTDAVIKRCSYEALKK